MSNAFNMIKALGYLSETAQAIGLVAALGPTPTNEQYVNLAVQLASLFDPALAQNKDFQAAEQIMADLAAAEAGTATKFASIPFQSNNTKLQLNISVGPAQ